jgi:phage major head subunit gpT-like protein
MAIVRTDIAKSLEYGIKANFLDAQQAAKPQRQAFVKEMSSTGAKETYVGLGEHPMPREFFDEIVPTDVNERSVVITNHDWEISIEVDDNAINDDRVGHVLDWAKSSGEAFERHMDKLAFKALNGGDGTTYGTCYDGKPFFANNHVDTGSGVTYTTPQSNVYSLDLTPSNFHTVYVAMLNFLDRVGEPVDLVPDLLIHPPALKDVATQISQNREKSGTPNRDINPFAGEIRTIQSPYLDATAWILVASGYNNKPIIFQVRQQPTLEIIRKGERRSTIYSWVARYYVGYGNWRLAIMGNT